MKNQIVVLGLGLLALVGCGQSDNAALTPAPPEAPLTTESAATPSGFAAVSAERLLNADAEPQQWMATGRS